MAQPPQPEQVSREQILFDRQVRLWGPHGQRKLRNTNILALGTTVTITEALKGVILPSVESFTMVDDELVTQYNISNNFFLTAKDLRKPLAQCLVAALGELNTSCRGVAVQTPISDYVIRLLVHTLYQLHHPSPQQHQQQQSSDMSDHQLESLTPQQYQTNLNNWLQSGSILDPTIQDLFKASTPQHTAAAPIPGLPPHLQPKGTGEAPIHTTSLFDFTMVLVDATRLPLSLHTTLSIFTTAFNIPILTLGSYSTLSMVKVAYPQRCVIESHFNTHNGAINLYINRHQLKRFPQLVELATADEFGCLDMARPADVNSMEYIDNKAKRSKVPYNLIIIRHALQFATNQNKSLDKLGGGDNEGLKKFIYERKWLDEDSYTEASALCRYLTGNLFHIQHMGNILNNKLITAPSGASFTIPNQECGLEIPIPMAHGNDPIPLTTFYSFGGLIEQVKLFQRCVGVTPTQAGTATHLSDQHALYGDYNHPFWLLVIALRLFILNFPIAAAMDGGNNKNNKNEGDAKASITPFLPHGLQIDGVVSHFTKLDHDLQQQSTSVHKAFGCFPINPSLPDMPASTELYGKIKQLYKNQFELDCGLFLIYLNYTIAQYAAQRRVELPGQNESGAWFASLDNFIQNLKSTMHVDDPIHYFVINARNMRVNEATTSLGYLSTNYQEIFEHLANDDGKTNNNNNPTATIPTFPPSSFWDLLTPAFITQHRILSSFSNAYDSTTLNSLISTPASQRRINSIQDRMQSTISEQAKPYLIDFYCSVLALYEFQYNSHRYPSTSTSLSNTTIKLSKDVYSISDPLSRLLHLTSMQLTTTTNNNAIAQSDLEQLETHHKNIFGHLTHGAVFLDHNWETISPALETTAHLFNHQFTELPTTASITGSIASDLMLKFALNQYGSVESAVLFDGLHSRGQTFFL